MQKNFNLLLMLLMNNYNRVQPINVNTAMPFVHQHPLCIRFEKASLMESLIAVVISQCQQPASTLHQSLDLQIKQASCHLDFLFSFSFLVERKLSLTTKQPPKGVNMMVIHSANRIKTKEPSNIRWGLYKNNRILR